MSLLLRKKACCCNNNPTANLYYCRTDAWTGYHIPKPGGVGATDYEAYYVNSSPIGTPEGTYEPGCYNQDGEYVYPNQNDGYNDYYNPDTDEYIDDCTHYVPNPDYYKGDCCYAVIEPLKPNSKDARDYFDVYGGNNRCTVGACCTDWQNRTGTSFYSTYLTAQQGYGAAYEVVCLPTKVNVTLSGSSHYAEWIAHAAGSQNLSTFIAADGTQQFAGMEALYGGDVIRYAAVADNPPYPKGIIKTSYLNAFSDPPCYRDNRYSTNLEQFKAMGLLVAETTVDGEPYTSIRPQTPPFFGAEDISYAGGTPHPPELTSSDLHGTILIPGRMDQTIGDPFKSCPTLAIPAFPFGSSGEQRYRCGVPELPPCGAWGGTFYVTFGDQSQPALSLAGAIYNPPPYY